MQIAKITELARGAKIEFVADEIDADGYIWVQCPDWGNGPFSFGTQELNIKIGDKITVFLYAGAYSLTRKVKVNGNTVFDAEEFKLNYRT